MQVKFHRGVTPDLRAIRDYYEQVSDELEARFLGEFRRIVFSVGSYPHRFHFDACGLRRADLSGFPYHVLFDFDDSCVRVFVVRHNRRHPRFGVNRKWD